MWYKNVSRSFFNFVTIHAFGRHTDRRRNGRISGSWLYRALHFVQSHGKNKWVLTPHIPIMYASAIVTFTHLYNMTLTFDLWPWKPFFSNFHSHARYCGIVCFTKIHPLSTEICQIMRHAKQMLADNGQTDRRPKYRMPPRPLMAKA